MRIVIEGINGKELVLLMNLLEKFDFGNKEELMTKWKGFLKQKEGA